MQGFFDFFISFWQLTIRVIFAKKAQVLFYYPQHFNRTAEGTNPFFDRLLETCDKHGITYKLIEEPDRGTDKPRNTRAIKGDVLFIIIILIHKIIRFCGVNNLIKQERITAMIVNLITLGQLKYSKYITISGSMLIVFIYLNQHATVYDMQHGILYKRHPTLFDEHETLRPHIANEPHWHWLMWGKGYEKCFCRGEEDILAGRTHVVGYPIKQITHKSFDTVSSNKIILFSLQFTHDWDTDTLEKAKEITEDALQQLQGCGIKVLLKHHPRFNNAISIDNILEKYPFAELTSLSMQELIPITLLQVTINSTTAFEYAAYGIPSFFIDSKDCIPLGNLFYRDYSYPLYQGLAITEVAKRLQNPNLREHDSIIVHNWYHKFYDEYDEDALLKLIYQ